MVINILYIQFMMHGQKNIKLPWNQFYHYIFVITNKIHFDFFLELCFDLLMPLLQA